MQTLIPSDSGALWSTIVNGRAVPGSSATVKMNREAPARRKIVGVRNPEGTKITSSAKGVWHLFVGRLSRDTQEDALKEYLESNGIIISEIRRLKPNQDWQEKVSAFRVSIALKCKDIVMDADLWPDNVEVRDWVFKK